MQSLYLVQNKPGKTIKKTLKFLFGLKKNIGGADVYAETLVVIARKSKDLEDLILNLDDRSFGEYHTFKRHEGSGEFLTLANVHQIKGQGFEVVFFLGSYGTIFNKYHNLQDEDTRINEIFVMHTAIARSSRYRSFKTACTNAGVPYGRKTPNGITFHDIRRTVKTHLLYAGVDKVRRDAIVGHSLKGMDLYYIVLSDKSLRQAMDQYTVWLDGEIEEADKLLENALNENKINSR